MEAADAGEAPGGRRRLQTARLQGGDVGADLIGLRLFRVDPALREVAEIVVEIAPIGGQGVGRRTAFGGEHVEKELTRILRSAWERGTVRAHRPPGWSFDGGMVTLISRGVGSTKVASANMPAKTRPARIAIVARKRNRVGKGTGLSPRIRGRAGRVAMRKPWVSITCRRLEGKVWRSTGSAVKGQAAGHQGNRSKAMALVCCWLQSPTPASVGSGFE